MRVVLQVRGQEMVRVNGVEGERREEGREQTVTRGVFEQCQEGVFGESSRVGRD